MSFPTTLPKQAIAEVLAFALSADKPSAGVVALSVYDLAGFGLYKYFGDEKYPVGSFNLSNLEQIFNLPAFQNVGQVVADFQAEIAAGKTKLQAILDLTVKYGPSLVETVLQILAITKA